MLAGVLVVAGTFGLLRGAGTGANEMAAAGSEAVKQRAIELIGYASSVRLTPEQAGVKTAALAGMPAACGRRKTLDVRCCTCNLGKTVFGLANSLIAREHADAGRVRQAVMDWLEETNPRGYAGDACDRHRCDRPFRQDGCGGMTEDGFVF